MYIWLFSRSVGAGSATTRNTRGLTRSVIALIVPPLPAPSRPSKIMHTLRLSAFTASASLLFPLPFNLAFFAMPDLQSHPNQSERAARSVTILRHSIGDL